VSTSGAVVWSAIYDSFGRCQVQVETVVNNLRFPGQYYDSETDLYYNLNRHYDPTTGRYLRADPFGDGINLYTYCFNNPLLFIDPEGFVCCKNLFYVRILTCEHVMFYRVINFMLPVDTLKVNRPLRSRRQVRKEEKLL